MRSTRIGIPTIRSGLDFARVTVHDLSFTEFAVGAGAGLRFSTPVGLSRLDLGLPLSRIDEQRAPRWHFSFGQMF